MESLSEPRKPNFVKLYSVDDPLVMDLEPVFRDMEIDELTTDFAIIFRAETGLTVKFQGMDPDEFTVDIPLVLDKQPDKRDECCIYKVPQLLREENNDSYTPKLISIGPFHQGNENLKSMEDLKMRYLKEACYRTNKSTKDLAGCILENEVKIRHCYAEVFEDISSKDFVKMVLFDSIFIIEHLWRTKQNPPMSKPIVSNSRTSSSFYKCQCRMLDSCLMTCQRGSEEDSRENRNPQPGNGEKENPWQSYNILQDLILLENQVPFFILEELYNFAYRDLNNCCCCQSQNHNGDGDNSFIKLVRDFFFHFWEETGLICSSDYKEILPEEVKKIRHFTDFLRYFLLPKEQKCGQSIDRVPCATKLAEAGVEFRGVKNRNLLDIKFQKSWLLKKFPCLNLSWLLSCFPCFKCLENMQPVLELQFFKVWDATECIIRNLMAFEQSHYPREAYVCNYIVLLDHLINTAEDVDVLVEKKVIVNWLGNNDAVANLINKLSNQIVEANHSCYYDLSKKIHSHYNSRWGRLMASLKNLYFHDFWRGTTTVVAILVLLLTFGSFITPFVFHR